MTAVVARQTEWTSRDAEHLLGMTLEDAREMMTRAPGRALTDRASGILDDVETDRLLIALLSEHDDPARIAEESCGITPAHLPYLLVDAANRVRKALEQLQQEIKAAHRYEAAARIVELAREEGRIP